MSKITNRLSSSLLATTFTFMVVVVSLLFYLQAEHKIDEAQTAKNNAITLSKELLHASERLTSLAKNYVVTGDSQYQQAYQEILAIRDGQKSRPAHSDYFNLVVGDKDIEPNDQSPPISLATLILNAKLETAEKNLLIEAKQNADQLIQVEQQAMALFDSAPSMQDEKKQLAQQTLFDHQYDMTTIAAMEPLDRFNERITKQTDLTIEHAARLANLFQWSLIICGSFWLLLLWRSYRSLLTLLGTSPTELHEAIVRLGQGDFSDSESPFTGEKDSVMAWLCATRRQLQQASSLQKQTEKQLLLKTQFLEQSETRLRTIIETSPFPTAILSLDGNILFINHAFTDCLGYFLSDIRTLEAWWPKAYPDPDYREWVQALWMEGLRHANAHNNIVMTDTEVMIQAKNGTLKTTTVEAIFIEDKMIDDFILVVFHDITALRQAEKALFDSKERLEVAAQAGIIGIWDWDIKAKKLVWDKVMYQLYGMPEHDVGDNYEAWRNAIHPDDKAFVEAEIQGALHGERSYAPEYRIIWPDGSIRYVKAMAQTFFDHNHKAIRMIGVNYDQTEQKHIQQQLDRLAFYDRLTSLPNRRLLEDRLNQAISLAHRENQRVALLFIDLDKFKQINDEKGHEAGDWLLHHAATRIQHCLRSSDTAARLGGDEFIVLLPNIKTDAEPLEVAERIRQVLEQPFIWTEKQTLDISSSIGIALYPDHAHSARDLLRFGDEAMYRAKKAGRNAIHIFNAHEQNSLASTTHISHLNWQSVFQSGEPTIDHEHQELFKLANKLIDCAYRDDLHSDQLIEHFELFLLHLRMHFMHEESILKTYHYIDLTQHAAQHQQLLTKAESLLQQLECGYEIAPIIQFVMSEVVLDHLTQEDQKFFDLFGTEDSNSNK